MTSPLITEQLRQLPDSPGVYLMKDEQGNIIYVGKANSLFNRVRSYFGNTGRLSPKQQQMVSRISDLEFFVTTSESEALVLELNLIKRHRPRYNVRLKDDKSYPYLKINIKEDWPRVHITRRLEPDGARYFGPFTSTRSLRQTLKLIKNIFPFRSCAKAITGTDPRPCLEYHIGQCLAPCTGAISRKEYASLIREVILFLEGKQERVVRELEKQMDKAAAALNFEQAALLRDQIQAVNRVIEVQRISAKVRGEQDAIAFIQDKDQAFVQIFLIRNNKLIGKESFVLQGTRDEEPSPIMNSFIKQFYSASPTIPPVLLLQYPVEDPAVIADWLSSKRGSRVHLQIPRRGHKKQLMDIVAENARQGLAHLKIKQLSAPSKLDEAIAEIQRELKLDQPPLRIEGYDISNIQGDAAVGSMVVFEKGRPKPAHYRRFRIKTVPAANDYAMLKEVLTRRFKRADGHTSEAWAVLPELVLIDGGKGHLNVCRQVMNELGFQSVPVASLAKENEEIFIPGKSEAVILDRSSSGLRLLQRVRDEAHRFAITYHRKVHKRQSFASALDVIPGIGPSRKRALLKQFGSVQAIRDAGEDELASINGITISLAKKVKEHL